MMSKSRQRAIALVVLAGMLLSVLLAVAANWASSSEPDGLERVAADEGFLDTAQGSAADASPFADYGTDLVPDDGAGSALAGFVGVAATALVAFGLFRVVARRGLRTDPADPS